MSDGINSAIVGNGTSDVHGVGQEGWAQVMVSGVFGAGATATIQIKKGVTDFHAPDADAVLTAAGTRRFPVNGGTEVRVVVASNAGNTIKVNIS